MTEPAPDPTTGRPTAGRPTASQTHRAGLFDIRTIIGALMGTYGVILVLMGLFADPETDKTGGTNANLWAGLVMLVVGIVFVAWARLRPVRVPDTGPDTGAAGSAVSGDAT